MQTATVLFNLDKEEHNLPCDLFFGEKLVLPEGLTGKTSETYTAQKGEHLFEIDQDYLTFNLTGRFR